MKIYMIRNKFSDVERTIYGKQTRFFVCPLQAGKSRNRMNKVQGDIWYVAEYDMVKVGELF